MGTDELGRDTMARIIHGAQVSLQVGVISVGIALVLGVSLGLLSGFYGGKVDGILMRFVDIMFALPGLVLAIVIAGLLGPNRRNAMIAIGIVITPGLRPRRARLGARGDGLPVRRVGAGARGVAQADHGPPRPAEHRRAADRARHRLPVDGDPQRGGA